MRKGTRGLMPAALAFVMIMSGCGQPNGDMFSQAGGSAAPSTPVTDGNIVRVNKFFSSDPWLSFTPDGTNRIDGVRFTLYLEGGVQNKGVFGTGTIVVTLFRLDREPTGREVPTQVYEWELPPDKAYPWRAKAETALGWGYGLRLGWDPKLELEGRQIAVVIKYIREDGTAVISPRKVLKVPVQDGSHLALEQAAKSFTPVKNAPNIVRKPAVGKSDRKPPRKPNYSVKQP